MPSLLAPPHRVGLAILVASLLLAALVLLRDPRAPAMAFALLVWGLLCCAATLVIVRRPGPVPPSPEPANGRHFAELVEHSLRHLRDLATLAGSELIALLPRTLGAASGRANTGPSMDPTPLEQARALARVLNEAIDRLKLASADEPAAGLEYEILHQEYRERRPTAQIWRRLNIAEATFHRHRRAAIQALAEDLRKGEEVLAAGRPSS